MRIGLFCVMRSFLLLLCPQGSKSEHVADQYGMQRLKDEC